MAIKKAGDISLELLEQSKAAQASPKEVFGLAHFGPAWPRLNLLTRGIQPRTFTLFLARQKVGKSTFISQMLPEWGVQAREVGKVVRVVTLETTMLTYLGRTAAQLAGIRDPLRIRAGMLEKGEVKNYRLALRTLNGLPVEFLSNEYDMAEEETFQARYSGIGLGQVEEFVRQPDTFLWVVDHVGLINRQGQGKGATEQLEAIANKLTFLSNRYVGGIGIHHLNRNSLDGGTPGFENIAGSDVFGRNAGALYFLWRPFFEARNRTPEDLQLMKSMGGDPGLLIFKSRSEGNGAVGVFWRDETASFEESDRSEEDLPRPGQAARRQPPVG